MEKSGDEVDGNTLSQVQSQCVIVDGEAPESDEEIASFSICSIPIHDAHEMTESSTMDSLVSTSRSNSANEFKSIFHRRLYNKNEDLWTHLYNLVHVSVATASKDLIAADRLLVKTQITLQSVSQTVKKVNTTSMNFIDKFRDVLTANFLPHINPPKLKPIEKVE